jgi:hypothetical protein
MQGAFELIARGCNIDAIRQEIANNTDLFGALEYRKKSDVHAQMDDIWVRYNDLNNLDWNDLKAFNAEHDSVWYPCSERFPALKRFCGWLMYAVQGWRLGAVLITRLPAGGKILPHVDQSWHAQYYDKYYIPIENKEGSVFGFEQGNIRPELGDVWQFDNAYKHWVHNDTDSERIALIVCIRRE